VQAIERWLHGISGEFHQAPASYLPARPRRLRAAFSAAGLSPETDLSGATRTGMLIFPAQGVSDVRITLDGYEQEWLKPRPTSTN